MNIFVLPFPVIDPVLVEFGPIAVRWYGLAYMAGIILGWLYARHLVTNSKIWHPNSPALNKAKLDDFLFWMALAIILGGRIGYILFYNFDAYLMQPFEIVKLWNGGMSFHGGFLAAVLAIILFAKRQNIRVWSLLDICAACTPLGLLFGRIANFINGELWGRVSDVPWAMVFPGAGPLPRHPSQLYEAFLEGIVLLVLLWWLIYRFGALKRSGLIAGTFTAGYGLMRLFVEFFREPDAQIGFLADYFTLGMLLSLPMILLGTWGVLTAWFRRL